MTHARDVGAQRWLRQGMWGHNDGSCEGCGGTTMAHARDVGAQRWLTRGMWGHNDGDERAISNPNTPRNTAVDDTTVLETGEVKTSEGELMLSHETGETLQVARV